MKKNNDSTFKRFYKKFREVEGYYYICRGGIGYAPLERPILEFVEDEKRRSYMEGLKQGISRKKNTRKYQKNDRY